MAVIEQTRQLAAAFAAGGLLCWSALFAWRAGTADVAGANLFMIPLLFLFVPAAVFVPMAVQAVARRLDRTRARVSGRTPLV